MSPDERELAILDRIRQELLADGYDVVIHPNRLMVPPFLGSFEPDALAFGKDRNLVIEVAAQSPSAQTRIRRLNELVAAAEGWDLKLVWISAGETPRSLPITDDESMRTTLEEIEALIELRRPRPAFLLLWATLEALGRRLMPSSVAKPQTPGRLVETLAREGHITPAEARVLRDQISRRNRLVHGDLTTEVRRKHVSDMLDVVRHLIERERIQRPEAENISDLETPSGK